MLDILMYWLGWLVFVVGQAQNSIASPSNNLQGWSGWKRWIQLHWYTLIFRAFWSLIGETAINHYVIGRVEPILSQYGLQLAVWGMAGVAGFAANTVLYMVFGVFGQKFPGLRVEVPLLAPPGPPAQP